MTILPTFGRGVGPGMPSFAVGARRARPRTARGVLPSPSLNGTRSRAPPTPPRNPRSYFARPPGRAGRSSGRSAPLWLQDSFRGGRYLRTAP